MEELKMEDGSIRRYKPIVKFRCIYCKRWATIADFLDANEENIEMGVMHESPECSEFTIMDPVIFTRNNRQYYEKEDMGRN
jgi:hypothetical protein